MNETGNKTSENDVDLSDIFVCQLVDDTSDMIMNDSARSDAKMNGSDGSSDLNEVGDVVGSGQVRPISA